MSICYHPEAFAAEPLRQGLAAGLSPEATAALLSEHLLTEPAIGWSLDGNVEGDLISCRTGPHDTGSYSLVDMVLLGLAALEPSPALAETAALLGRVGSETGTLKACEPFVGYLLPEDMAVLSERLSGLRFADPAQDSDRELLLGLFAKAAEHGVGLAWSWA